MRDGLSRLKRLLDAYYASLGIEDRLNLELDRYKAIFSYNLRHPVEREFRLAARYVGSDPKAAFKHLSAVLSFDPNHAEAHAAWAETEMWRAFYGYDMGLPEFLATSV